MKHSKESIKNEAESKARLIVPLKNLNERSVLRAMVDVLSDNLAARLNDLEGKSKDNKE